MNDELFLNVPVAHFPWALALFWALETAVSRWAAAALGAGPCPLLEPSPQSPLLACELLSYLPAPLQTLGG